MVLPLRPVAAALVIAIVALTLPGADAGEQSGSNSDCLDYLVLYAVPGIHGPGFRSFPVEPGTTFQVWSDSGLPYVDFYDGSGTNVGVSDFGGSGVVPHDAVFGSVCVTTGIVGWPDAPMPDANWWYVDGF